MKAIAICGSPREHGNTEYYLEIMLAELQKLGWDTELIPLRDKTILPCRGCYGCLEHKRCVQEDDFEAVYAKMHAADAIIIGSPVYVSKPTSLLQALLERATFAGRGSGRLLSGKVGAPVTVARRAGTTLALSELLLWYFINDLVVPGSMYWNVGVAGARGARDAERDLEGIEIMKYSANNIAKVAKALEGTKTAAIAQNKLFYQADPDKKD